MTPEEQARAHALANALRQEGAAHALNYVTQVGAAATIQQAAEIAQQAQAAYQAEQDRAAANARRLAERQPRWHQGGLTTKEIEHDLGVLYGGDTAHVMDWAIERDPRLAHALGDAVLGAVAQQEVGRLRDEAQKRAAAAEAEKERSQPGYRPAWRRPTCSVSERKNSEIVAGWMDANLPWLDETHTIIPDPPDEVPALVNNFLDENPRYRR